MEPGRSRHVYDTVVRHAAVLPLIIMWWSKPSRPSAVGEEARHLHAPYSECLASGYPVFILVV